MTAAEAAAQVRLRRVVEGLGALSAELLAIHESLPVSPQETAMLLGEEVMDVSTVVRSVIECVLHDRLQPAICDLEAAAHYRPEGELDP